MLNPQAIAREVRRVKPATPRNPAPKTSQPRPLSFRSEIKQAWISVEDLPTLHDFALNEFEAEAGSIRCSLETQLKTTTGDPDWQRRARLKLGKVKEFETALLDSLRGPNAAVLDDIRSSKDLSDTTAAKLKGVVETVQKQFI